MKRILLIITILWSPCVHAQQNAFRVNVYGKGEPIILVPGYGCSGEVWKQTVESLKSKYQLHVLTLAGYAGVPPIDSPILATVKSQLIEYVRTNHLNKPVLIGHSLGAFVCLWAASEDPSMFSKVLCVDGVPFVAAISRPGITADQLKNNPSFDEASLAAKYQQMPDKDFEDQQFKTTLNLVGDTTYARQITNWNMESDRKTLGYTYAEMYTTDLREAISAIDIPVLIVGSNYGTVAQSKTMLSQQFSALRNKTIIIANTKHFIMYDDPAWFNSQVKNFLVNGLFN
jgi:N-formylmaleamate deformylase